MIIEKDHIPLVDQIHVELAWKIKKMVEVINNRKLERCKNHDPLTCTKNHNPSTFTSILNDCIHVGIENSNLAEFLEYEYDESDDTYQKINSDKNE